MATTKQNAKQPAGIVHVRPVGHAHELASGGVIGSPARVLVREGCDLVVPLQHGPDAREAIAAELVACTLGARRRPEPQPQDDFLRLTYGGVTYETHDQDGTLSAGLLR